MKEINDNPETPITIENNPANNTRVLSPPNNM
jgi:hypothetical protein